MLLKLHFIKKRNVRGSFLIHRKTGALPTRVLVYAPDVLLVFFTVDSCSEKSLLGCNNSGCPVVDVPGLIVIGVVVIVVVRVFFLLGLLLFTMLIFELI